MKTKQLRRLARPLNRKKAFEKAFMVGNADGYATFNHIEDLRWGLKHLSLNRRAYQAGFEMGFEEFNSDAFGTTICSGCVKGWCPGCSPF